MHECMVCGDASVEDVCTLCDGSVEAPARQALADAMYCLPYCCDSQEDCQRLAAWLLAHYTMVPR